MTDTEKSHAQNRKSDFGTFADIITVSDLLNIMTASQLRILVSNAYLQPYMRGYWKFKKSILVKKLSKYFVIVNDNNGAHLSKVVDKFTIEITI